MSFMITACVPATAPRNAPRSRKPIFIEPDDGVYEECVPGAQLRREDHVDYNATGCHIGYIFKKTLQSCIRPQSESDKKLGTGGGGEYKSYERPEENESMILDNALFEPKQPPGSIGSNSDASTKISAELSLSCESTTTGPMAKFARTGNSTRNSASNSSGSVKSKSPPNYGMRPSGSPELDAIVNSIGSSPAGSPNSHNYHCVNSDDYESAVLVPIKSNPATNRRQMVPNKKPEKSVSLPPSGKLWGKPISSDWKSSLKDPFRSKKKFTAPALEKVYELPEKEALYDISRDPVLNDLARVAREVKEAAAKDKISAEETYPDSPFVSQPSIRSRCSDVSRRLNSFSVAARLSPNAMNRCASRNHENQCLDNAMASLTLSDSSGSQKQLLSLSSAGPEHKAGEIDIRDDGIIYSIEKVRRKGKRPVEMNPVPLCVPGMQGFVPPYCRVSAVRARRALLRRHNSKASRGSKTFSDTTWASSEARRKRRLKPACKGQDHYCRDVKVTPCVSTLRKKKNEFERARKRANVGANKGARKKAYVFNWLLVNQGVIGNPAEKERARRLAKERSTLLWLLSKAYKGRVPTDLRSPHYKESGNQYRLKPDIVDLLSSCNIYCMVLRGIYDDPSYNELSFGQILVMLARKGIEVKTLKEGIKITPRILEECSPLNMSAHLNFADALMELFVREILIPSKVCQVVQRFANYYPNSGSVPSSIGDSTSPIEFEDAALLWINRSAQSLRGKVHAENREILPKVVHAQDLTDLSDGSALACLISLYCPQHLSYYDINFLPSMSLADSLSNHHLIKEFCERHLPQDVHFVTMEDLLFPHAAIRTNILVFIADLMYLFEIKPCKVVQVPGIAQYVVKRESNKEIPITAL